MVVSLNYCSQNGGNVYRDPYYNGNPDIGPRIMGNLDEYPYKDYTGTHYNRVYIGTRENQMDNKMENKMESGKLLRHEFGSRLKG